MPVATTAAEFVAFINDDAYWAQSGWDHYDDTVFIVDGKEINDLDVEALAPETPICVEYGFVANADRGKTAELTTFFAKWQKQQASQVVAIALPKHLTVEQLADHLAKLDPQITVEFGK